MSKLELLLFQKEQFSYVEASKCLSKHIPTKSRELCLLMPLKPFIDMWNSFGGGDQHTFENLIFIFLIFLKLKMEVCKSIDFDIFRRFYQRNFSIWSCLARGNANLKKNILCCLYLPIYSSIKIAVSLDPVMLFKSPLKLPNHPRYHQHNSTNTTTTTILTTKHTFKYSTHTTIIYAALTTFLTTTICVRLGVVMVVVS